MKFMFFKDWYVYNKINNQDKIDQGLDNRIPLSQISQSLKDFWINYFNQLPLPDQITIERNYYNYVKQIR